MRMPSEEELSEEEGDTQVYTPMEQVCAEDRANKVGQSSPRTCGAGATAKPSGQRPTVDLMTDGFPLALWTIEA